MPGRFDFPSGFFRRAMLVAVVALAVAAVVFTTRTTSWTDLRRLLQTPPGPDVVFVPTPPAVVHAMLEVATVTPDDLVMDLGSGDGRVVIAAARDFGATAIGIEIDAELIEQARENAREAGVADRVQFLQQDLFQADISKASVVTLYLMPMLNLKLRPRLFRSLQPGTRVVSHAFDMGDWKPDKELVVEGRHVYLWVVPPDAKEKP
jgi:SAM-dependent methyltransferase